MEQPNDKGIAELRGRVAALGVALGLMLKLERSYGNEQVVLFWNREVQELINNYTSIPFQLSDDEAEGFRHALSQLSEIAQA